MLRMLRMLRMENENENYGLLRTRLENVERYLCLMFKLYNKYYIILCVHDTHNA